MEDAIEEKAEQKTDIGISISTEKLRQYESQLDGEFSGYMKNAKGMQVPLALIKPIEIDRDKTVRGIVAFAEEMAEFVNGVSQIIMDEVDTYTSRSLAQYGVSYGGNKGNIQLMNYDGTMKIKVAIAEQLEVTEEILAAKELVEQCVKSWSVGANEKIKMLAYRAFEADNEGKISVRRLLDLKAIDIDDEDWKTAMTAAYNSIKVVGTKQQLRIYKKDKNGKFRQLKLKVE